MTLFDDTRDVKATKQFLLGSPKVDRPPTRVRFTSADVDFATTLGALRHGRGAGRTDHKIAALTGAEIDHVGARGEVAFALYYGLPMPALDLGAAAGDVAGVEIKTTKHLNGRLLLWNPKQNDPDRPVCLVIDEGVLLRIAGWMRTREILVDEFRDESMKKPCWAVPQRRLHDPESLRGLL